MRSEVDPTERVEMLTEEVIFGRPLGLALLRDDWFLAGQIIEQREEKLGRPVMYKEIQEVLLAAGLCIGIPDSRLRTARRSYAHFKEMGLEWEDSAGVSHEAARLLSWHFLQGRANRYEVKCIINAMRRFYDRQFGSVKINRALRSVEGFKQIRDYILS